MRGADAVDRPRLTGSYVLALDTSAVLRLIIGAPAAQADAARRALVDAQRTGDEVIITDTVIGEAYFALLHHYEMPEAEVLSALRALLESGLVVPEPALVLQAFPKAGAAGFMDRLIHARHKALGVTTLTFDRRMGRLSGVRRLTVAT